MMFVQVFVSVCFGLPALFLFGVGCKSFEQALKLAGAELGEGADRAVVIRAVVGLGAFMLSAVVAVVAALLCRAVAA